MMDGFQLIPEVISDVTEWELIERIKTVLARSDNRHDKAERSRVKRYGYDYTEKLKMLEPIPDWMALLYSFRPISDFTIFNGMTVNSVTINEYQPGHGITPHIDATYFGSVIAILSLGGSATMVLTPPDPGRTESPLARYVPPRSLIILSGDVRKTWKHAIEGKSVTETRYSIVFRERLLK